MRSKEIEQSKKTIFTVHEWEKMILWYAHFEDLRRNDWEMTEKWLRNDWEKTEKWLRNDWEMTEK